MLINKNMFKLSYVRLDLVGSRAYQIYPKNIVNHLKRDKCHI